MRWNRNENREISQMEKRSNKKFRPHPAVIFQSLNLSAENARRYSLLDLHITWRHGGIVHIRYWTLAETFLCFLIANFECAARREFPSVVHLTRHWGTLHSRYWTLANSFLFFTLPTCWNQQMITSIICMNLYPNLGFRTCAFWHGFWIRSLCLLAWVLISQTKLVPFGMGLGFWACALWHGFGKLRFGICFLDSFDVDYFLS